MGLPSTLAAKPGDDLLFHRLSDSTIGAVWFHGRVRDGIGWFTDAMTTRLWSERKNWVIDAVFIKLETVRSLSTSAPFARMRTKVRRPSQRCLTRRSGAD